MNEYSLTAQQRITSRIKKALGRRYKVHTELQKNARSLLVWITLPDDVSELEVEISMRLIEDILTRIESHEIPLSESRETWSVVFTADSSEVYKRFRLPEEERVIVDSSGGRRTIGPIPRAVFGSPEFYEDNKWP